MNRRTTIFVVVGTLLFIVASVMVTVSASNQSTRATDRNRQIGLSNNTYLRTMVCIASVSPVQRTPDYVQGCYDQAEAANGVGITRYGDGRLSKPITE